MLNHVIAFALRNRLLVLLVAVAAAGFGLYQLRRTPVDVFPDLNRPTVTVLTEAGDLAPEDVEALVTRPIEYLLNGATGVQRVRSASALGLSVVWVEFDWDSDVYRDRQIVEEKLQLARRRLPAGANPVLAPISSIMGEILLLGLRSDAEPATEQARLDRAMELRTLAEFDLRNRLLAIPGVAQVTALGGVLKEYQVVTSPQRLAAEGVTLEQLAAAAEKANVVAGGGVTVRPPRETVLRISGRSLTLHDLEATPVVWRGLRPVLIRDVADVRFGGPVRRGDGGVLLRNGEKVGGGPAVIVAVQKQPGADTVRLDGEINSALDAFARDLPAGVRIERGIFSQADFIRAAIDNVSEAVRDGALWVVVVLFVFLWNVRVSACTLIAMPLSLLMTFLAFRWLGVSVNTMTLGGIAIAIGDLVDDSIVDIENIYRRLKENAALPQPRPALEVVYAASCEVRGAIVYATWVVVLVVFPLFSLGGLEGRLFAPMGVAYVTALLASLLVSLTVTPVLGSLLLPRAKLLREQRDPPLLRWLKAAMAPVLRFTLRHARAVLRIATALVGLSVLCLFWMGGRFLPPFNEGTFTINVSIEPGASLDESVRVAKLAERLILEVPEVASVARRTGRAELDEHAEGVHSSELDVRLSEHERPLPGFGYGLLRLVPVAQRWAYEEVGRPRDKVEADIRERLSHLPVKVNIGQPIAHRLDHILTGVRAQVVVKVFGPHYQELRHLAHEIEERMAPVAGVVDLQTEPLAMVSQWRLEVKRQAAADHGLAPGDVARLLETAYKGRVVSQVLDGERTFAVRVWYDARARASREEIGRTILDTPSGRKVALSEVVDVIETVGPNTLGREGGQPRLAVFCNIDGRDLAGAVGDIRAAVAEVERRLPPGYRIEYGGQFEAQREAETRLWILGSFAVVAIFLLLTRCLESWRAALQVLANVPLAAIGSVIALMIVNRPSSEALAAAPWWDWPRVWASATTLSLAHWVGFITLVGIVSRNGILMISHYLHLMREEGEAFGEAMIVRGTLERLAPVLMTAVTSFVGLLPLLSGAGQTGKEILHPLAVVVFGGMLSSTLLDQLVTPALFYLYGGKEYDRPLAA